MEFSEESLKGVGNWGYIFIQSVVLYFHCQYKVMTGYVDLEWPDPGVTWLRELGKCYLQKAGAQEKEGDRQVRMGKASGMAEYWV